jgi:hypothetical protein
MTRDHFRTIGALVGLAAGIALMILLSFRGIIPAAIFGATGCVLGGMTAEAFHTKLLAQRKSDSHDSTINRGSKS